MLGCVQGLDPPSPTALVEVPGGVFLFGSTEPCFPEDKPTAGCGPDENPYGMPQIFPTMRVEVKPFAIEQHEVTNYQYEYCVAMGKCREPAAYNLPKFVDSYYGNPLYRNYPVVNVTIEMAEEYCRFVGRRLPTEFEWELVAGGAVMDEKAKRLYPYDGDTGRIEDCRGRDIAITYCNGQSGPKEVMTAKDDVVSVGEAKVHDLMGNVAEWVAGRYKEAIACKESIFPECQDCFTCDKTPNPKQCKETCYLDEFCEKCANNPDCFRQCDEDPSKFPGIPRCISYGQTIQKAHDLVATVGPEALARGGSYSDEKGQTCRARVADRQRHLTVSETTKAYNIGFRCAVDR